VVDMSKINREIAVFIIFLILVVLAGIFIKTLVDKGKPSQEPQVVGLLIEFENGTTEPEVKAILENCNMTMNYSIDYKTYVSSSRYYVKVDKDKEMDIIDQLRKEDNLFDPNYQVIKKGNYYVIVSKQISEPGTDDKVFLEVMEKNNLQVKETVVCDILGDGSTGYSLGKNYILESDAIRIRNELEANEKVLIVFFTYMSYKG
jgi:Uncharacterised protein family (UPF0228)